MNVLPDRLAHPKRCAALTLLEMLVVVAIMVIVASFMAPVLGALLRGKSLTRAIDEVSSMIEMARTEAMSKNTYVWLGFNNVPALSGTTPVNWQIQVAAMRSLDGTPNMASTNLRPVNKVMKFDNVVMCDPAHIKGNALTKLQNAGFVLTGSNPVSISGTGCYSATNFVLSGGTFSQLVVFTPQGQGIRGATTGINSTTPFTDQFLVGLRRTAGSAGAVTSSGTTAFLATASDADQAAIVFQGGTVQVKVFRP